jgi:hypothetical protein
MVAGLVLQWGRVSVNFLHVGCEKKCSARACIFLLCGLCVHAFAFAALFCRRTLLRRWL